MICSGSFLLIEFLLCQQLRQNLRVVRFRLTNTFSLSTGIYRLRVGIKSTAPPLITVGFGFRSVAGNKFHDLFHAERLLHPFFNRDKIPHSGMVLVFRERNGYPVTFVGFPFHLIDVPVSGKQTQVHDTYIPAETFHFLCIP